MIGKSWEYKIGEGKSECSIGKNDVLSARRMSAKGDVDAQLNTAGEMVGMRVDVDQEVGEVGEGV